MNVSVYQEMAGFYKEGNASGNETLLNFQIYTLNKVINYLVIAILFLIMICIGCSLEIFKMKEYFLKPKGPVIAILAQFGIMPLGAFCICKSLQLEPIMALALLICGCCPGGTLSNVFTVAIKGDINLSMVMTTCSNIAALGMMPLLLYIYCNSYRGLEKMVPFKSIIITLAQTLVPCAIGIAIRYYKPKYITIVKKVGFSLLAIIGIIAFALSGFLMKEKLLLLLRADVLTATALLPLTGYMLGYAMSKICRLNSISSRTIAMETGCQNTNLCVTILKVAFPPQLIGPVYLVPFLFLIMQTVEAFLFILAFRCYKKYKTQPANAKICKNVDVQPEAVKLQQHHEEPGTEEENEEKRNSAH